MSRYRKTFREALEEIRSASELKEFKKMTVTFTSMDRMAKASTDLAKKGFTIDAKGLVMKVDGKGADLNKYAADLKNFYGASKIIAEQDEKDHEISMARGELEAIADKAIKLSSMLQGKSDDGNPLEAWVQSKITKAKDYINSVSDYMEYNPEQANEQLKESDAYDNNRYMMKKYMGQILARLDNSNTKDGKDHVYAPNAKIAKQLYSQGKKVYREELELQEGVGHISGFRNDKEKANMISLAKQHGLKVDDTGGKLKLSGNMRKILDMQLAAQGNGFKAEDFRVGISEGTMIGGIIKHAGQTSAEYQKARLQYKTFMSKPQQAKGAEDKVLKFIFDDELLDDLYVAAKKNPTMDVRDTVKKRLAKLGIKEDLDEETLVEFTTQQIKQAYGILNDPRYKGGNYDGAVKAIEKLAKGLSKHPDVANALKRANEEVELEEGFSDAQIAVLKKQYEPLRGKKISIDNANKLGALFSKFDKDKNALEKLYGGDIPFVSTMAMTRLLTKHNYKASDLNKIRKEDIEFELPIIEEVEMLEGKMSEIDAMQKAGKSVAEIAKALKLPVNVVKGILGEVKEEVKKEEPMTPADIERMKKQGMKPKKEEEQEEKKPEENTEKLKAEIEKKDNEIAQLKVKAETEKAKTAKKETEKMVNPETGEPLLQVGIAYKHLRDKMKTVKKEEVDNYPTSDINKKKHDDAKDPKKGEKKPIHPAKEVYESIEAIKKKAEKTGMPYSVLKQVYDRGMAAWRGGHRPGATQVQWALARVNSFVTKSSGTWGGADKDLAAKVKGK